MKFAIKVIPGAKKEEITQEKDANGNPYLKIKTSKPPEDGRANEAVIELLAKYFKVKKNAVRILSGEISRNKIVEIEM